MTHVMDINAQELIQMAGMRLCSQAALETRQAMEDICSAVLKTNPEFRDFLMPKCLLHGGCNEFSPCGFYEFCKEAEK